MAACICCGRVSPSGGRTLSVLEAIYPQAQKHSPRAERAFLRRLQALLPAEVKPIIVTDAGFRAPWFRTVTSLGWDYVGRLRHRTLVRLRADAGWVANRTLHRVARSEPRRFRAARIVRNAPWRCDLVLVRKRRRGRQRLTARGVRARSKKSLKAARANRDPWLLATSLIAANNREVTAIYAKRMQIEESFRDLKCDRFGCAFRCSLTRTAKRLAIMLLLHALATFVAWLAALATDAQAVIRYGGIASRGTRRHYSLLRLGWERLRQGWETLSVHDMQCMFSHPPAWALRELMLPG